MNALPNHWKRTGALLALVALAAAVLVAGPLSPRASATSVNVANEAQWRQALADLSLDSAGPHTITITAPFTITNPTLAGFPTYEGDQHLTIEGGGHVISYDPVNTTNFLSFYPTSG